MRQVAGIAYIVVHERSSVVYVGGGCGCGRGCSRGVGEDVLVVD